MASYIELRNLFDDDTLKNRMDFAIVDAANTLLGGTPTTDEQKWAAKVANNPRSEAKKAFMFVLAANKTATPQTIIDATDTALQTQVDAVVDTLVIANGA